MGRYFCYLVKSLERQHPEIQIIETNTDEDHIHILCSIAPKLSIADAVKIVKANTARLMKKKFPFLVKGYWDSETIWSVGYFVSGVGVDEKRIKRYVEWQGKKDSGQAQVNL